MTDTFHEYANTQTHVHTYSRIQQKFPFSSYIYTENVMTQLSKVLLFTLFEFEDRNRIQLLAVLIGNLQYYLLKIDEYTQS